MRHAKKLAVLAVAATSLMLGLAAPAEAASTGSCTTYVTYGYNASTYRVIPSTAGGNVTCRLSKGNQSPAVTVLQRSLKYCALYPLAVDGIFGNQTRSALIAYQSNHRLTADGIYGPSTRSHFWFLDRASNPTTPYRCHYCNIEMEPHDKL